MVKSQPTTGGERWPVGRDRRKEGEKNQWRILLEILRRHKTGEDCTSKSLRKALGIGKTSVHKHLKTLMDEDIFKDGNQYRADTTIFTDPDKALDLLKKKAHLSLYFFEIALPRDRVSKQKLSDGTMIPVIDMEICTCLAIMEALYRLKQEEINLAEGRVISNAYYDGLAVDITEFIGSRLSEAFNLEPEAWESLTQKDEPFWYLILGGFFECRSHEEYFSEEDGARIDALFREWQKKKEKFHRE